MQENTRIVTITRFDTRFATRGTRENP